MGVIRIFSKNSAFQKSEALKSNRNKRYKYNEFLVEGVRSLNEAVQNGWKIKSFLYGEGNLSGWASDMIGKVDTDVNDSLTAELMRELSGKEDTSELMAVIEMRENELDKVSLETAGLSRAFKETSDRLCTIPMSEKSYATSFNVSCAASSFMYGITRQRGMGSVQ